MRNIRDLSLRVINAGLIATMSFVHRIYGSRAVYKISKDGASVSFEGSWFAYRPKEFGATGNIDLVPEAEDATRKEIFSRLEGHETFFDIGAHGGVYTITLQKRFPNLNLHSFEPQPEDILCNLALNNLSDAKVHRVAVGESAGIVRMTTGARSSNHVSEQGTREVPIVKLDEYVALHNIPDPSWIKIDIEGLELPALRGAEQILRRSKPIVICEINHLFDRYETSISDFREFMSAVGLYAHRLHDGSLVPIGTASTLAELGYSADNNFWFIPKSEK